MKNLREKIQDALGGTRDTLRPKTGRRGVIMNATVKKEKQLEATETGAAISQSSLVPSCNRKRGNTEEGSDESPVPKKSKIEPRLSRKENSSPLREKRRKKEENHCVHLTMAAHTVFQPWSIQTDDNYKFISSLKAHSLVRQREKQKVECMWRNLFQIKKEDSMKKEK